MRRVNLDRKPQLIQCCQTEPLVRVVCFKVAKTGRRVGEGCSQQFEWQYWLQQVCSKAGYVL